LTFGVILILAFIAYGSLIGKAGSTGAKVGMVSMAIVLVIGSIWMVFGVFGFLNTYGHNSEVASITLETDAGVQQSSVDLGNYTMLSALVESYATRDESLYSNTRLLAKDDKVRLTFKVNNTANWNSTNQNLTDVTARLKFYVVPAKGLTDFEAATEWISPNTEIGDVNYGDTSIIVFDNVDANRLYAYGVLEILDSDGTVLGTAYIHPAETFGVPAWFLNQQA
jgi:hypothetical protein